MNWYHIFYWISVADGMKEFFIGAVILLSIVTGISLIGFFVGTYNAADRLSSWGNEDKDYKSSLIWKNAFKRVWSICIFLLAFSWIGYVFIPSKKDCLVIVAGGAVGNFITRDSSAKQIPSEVMTLLRDKIRSEITEVHLVDIKDTLVSKSKEELMEIIKNKH